MKRGGKFLVSTTILAVSACGGDQGDLRVRSIPTPLAQGVKPVPFRIAEARGQLALGNIALALEGFRKAWRDDPNSPDALAGMANCYDRMGRFDLSRRNYEAALALAPADVELLGAFAQSLQLQGRLAEANRVRVEIAQRTAAQAPQLARAEVSAPVALTASAPLVAQEAEVSIPRPVLAAPPVEVTGTVIPARMDVSVPNLEDARMVAEAPAPAPAPAPDNSEVVELIRSPAPAPSAPARAG